MGLCGSSMTEAEKLEYERSRQLEAQNQEDHLVEQEKIKLLLLGEFLPVREAGGEQERKKGRERQLDRAAFSITSSWCSRSIYSLLCERDVVLSFDTSIELIVACTFSRPQPRFLPSLPPSPPTPTPTMPLSIYAGAGESGKSTIFKQMKLIYGEQYTDDDLKAITPVVYNNSITSMKVLIEQCKNLGLWDGCGVKEVGDEFMQVNDDKAIDDKIGDMIIALWKDGSVNATYKRKSEFQLNDSAKYYFKKMDVIKQDGYIATVEDLLRSRVRTSGIVEEVYTIDEVVFVMYDVGGQRNERKKWIHCFDSVT